jgi:hypothetical protein
MTMKDVEGNKNVTLISQLKKEKEIYYKVSHNFDEYA